MLCRRRRREGAEARSLCTHLLLLLLLLMTVVCAPLVFFILYIIISLPGRHQCLPLGDFVSLSLDCSSSVDPALCYTCFSFFKEVKKSKSCLHHKPSTQQQVKSSQPISSASFSFSFSQHGAEYTTTTTTTSTMKIRGSQ